MKLAFSLVFFALIALVFFWQSYRLLRRALPGMQAARASRTWQSVPGTVTIVTVNMDAEKFKRRHQTYFRPWVQCSYNVNGKDYVCDRQVFNHHLISLSEKKDAEALIQKYQVGQSVPVYYNPADPANSVLEQGNPGPSWSFVGWSAVNLVLALLFLVFIYLAVD